jgi:hypothetical protein
MLGQVPLAIDLEFGIAAETYRTVSRSTPLACGSMGRGVEVEDRGALAPGQRHATAPHPRQDRAGAAHGDEVGIDAQPDRWVTTGSVVECYLPR